MKVLHIVTRADSGGISTLIYNYYKQMDHTQIQFDLVAIDSGVPHGYQKYFEKIGMHVYYMPNALIKRFCYLIKLIHSQKYNVVHAHIELQSVFYLIVALLCGVKTRVSHAHLSRRNEGLKNKILRFILNRVATHRVGASDLSIKAVFGSEKDALVINNAIDVDRFSFDLKIRQKYRQDLNVEEKFVVGFVGRLSHQKNIPFLVKVFSGLEKKTANVVLLVVGDGELYGDMLHQLESLGLLSKVIFLKTRNDVNALMMAMDVMLLPSFYEGLPLVLVEAQATALKCIVSDKITQLISITDYIVYKSIEDHCVDEWVDAIIDNAMEYSRCSMKEKITSEHFNIEYESERLIDIYKGK